MALRGGASYLKMLKVGSTAAMSDAQHKTPDYGQNMFTHPLGIREVIGSIFGPIRC